MSENGAQRRTFSCHKMVIMMIDIASSLNYAKFNEVKDYGTTYEMWIKLKAKLNKANSKIKVLLSLFQERMFTSRKLYAELSQKPDYVPPKVLHCTSACKGKVERTGDGKLKLWNTGSEVQGSSGIDVLISSRLID